MLVKYGPGTTQYGPGVSIELTGDEVAQAISLWLYSQEVFVSGPRTITVNGQRCKAGHVYVDPSGSVINKKGIQLLGRGPTKEPETLKVKVMVDEGVIFSGLGNSVNPILSLQGKGDGNALCFELYVSPKE